MPDFLWGPLLIGIGLCNLLASPLLSMNTLGGLGMILLGAIIIGVQTWLFMKRRKAEDARKWR